MQTNPAPIPAETVDWSFVVDDGCAECGYSPHPAAATAARIANASALWQEVLARTGAAERPAPSVWSPTEYACHVCDMLSLLGKRVALMLQEDDPLFSNWDQDQVAVDQGYYWADPAVVRSDLALQAEAAASALSHVRDGSWSRTGRRSDGVTFTVASLCRFVLHDVEHHLHDVGGAKHGPAAPAS